jgi:uncharacterized membrane protein YfcA
LLDLLASPLGLVVGLVLGALGGGGSILAIPALVYGAGQDFQAATTASLIIVGTIAVAGAARHHGRGNVDLRSGLVFGAAGTLGALAGTVLNRSLDQSVLKIAFAVLMLVVAARMLRGGDDEASDGPATGTSRWLRIVLAGSAVGVLTGLFGVGGGFVIVPALVLLLGFSMPVAVGTSLVVITINALVALGARADTLGAVDWGTVAPFTVMGLVGVWLGGKVADRFDAARLTTAFGVLLVLVALYTGGDGVVTLLSA